MNSFEAVASLLVIGIAGFYVISKKVIPEKAVSVLATLAVDVALPALVFAKILTSFSPSDMPRWWTWPLWWAGFALLSIILTLAMAKLFRKDIRDEVRASLVFNNAVFFPLAIVTGIYGSGSVKITQLFLFTLFYPPFYFGIVHLFFKESKDEKVPISKIFNPVLVSTIAAVGIVLLGLDRFVPQFVVKAVGVMGQMAAPLLMMILGGSIYIDFRDKGNFRPVQCLKFVVMKNIVMPFIMLGLVYLLHIPAQFGFMLVLQASVPPITSLSVMTDRCGGDRHLVNQFIFSSFIAAIITIPIFVMLYDMMVGC